MRLALESLGGAWLKLGQMLALRYDLLPAAYCDELFGLLNQVAPFPYDEVCRIVREELGDDPEAIFATFETQSFAAASIGQVHRATLQNGDRVAVKVQRPAIRQTLRADIDLMYGTSWLLDRVHLFGVGRSRDLVDEFARWTEDELDYMVEARQAVLLWEHAQGDRHERIARVYRDYTTSRVLTTELIEGVPLIEIIVARRNGDHLYLDALADAGHDLDRIIRRLDWNMLNQVFVFGYFHADLHPANLFVLPNDAIGYVDFGIVGQLPNRVRDSLIRYSWLLFRGDVEGAVRELMRWLAPGPGTDTNAARWQLIRIHQAFLYDTVAGRTRVTEGAPGPYSRLAMEILGTIRVHELTLSSSLMAYLKMLVTLGTLRHALAIEYDLQANVRQFVGRLARQQGLAWLDPRRTVDRLFAGAARIQRTLEFVEFLEGQEAFIVEAQSSVFGFRRRLRNVRRRLVSLGVGVLLVGAVLYVVLAFPDETRAVIPRDMPYPFLHYGLLALLVILIVNLIANVRGMGDGD
jgi:predicted unusual protein kinase regulating ubiquinone biosynthesis (AarF/ABC1/UbiB family)